MSIASKAVPFLREVLSFQAAPSSAWNSAPLAFDPVLAAQRLHAMNRSAGDRPAQVASSGMATSAVVGDSQDAGSSPAGLEVVLGRSNLLPACFLEQGAQFSRAVCLIQASGVNYQRQQGSWTGTGFLVSPNLLLTNHHVLNSFAVAQTAQCVFNYQTDTHGRLQSTQTFRLDPSRLFLTSPVTPGGLDFTFVWVEGGAAEQFGHISLNRSALSIAVHEFANVVSHPNGEPKAIALQENLVQWQDELVVHYSSDTMPGSSGACVFNNRWQLIALHHASTPTTSVPGYSVLNEGIKLSAIAAQLERWAQADTDRSPAREVLAAFQGSDETLGFFGSLGRQIHSSVSEVEAVVDAYRGEFQDVDVAFWNVEWFSRRYEEKVEAVSDVMFRMNLDIWALEESSAEAAERLVEVLQERHGLEFDFLAAEPNASSGKQSCTVLWNRNTVSGSHAAWGEPIESWLAAHSRDFEDLGLEAVEGRIFDRYPVLMQFQARRLSGQTPFDFMLVPVHLKAMAEGSKRRRMASEILAAAVRKKIAQGADGDWIIGGDFNAELASEDFSKLADGAFIPLTAADEVSGAFTYLKRPHRSLIDHIFVSKQLSRHFGASDLLIVAAEREIPDYITHVSDHRPVLLRMSLQAVPQEETAAALGMELTADQPLYELKQVISALEDEDDSTTASAAMFGVENQNLPAEEIAEAFRRSKRDSYFWRGNEAVASALPPQPLGVEDAGVVPAMGITRQHPMLLRLNQAAWNPPPEFTLQSQIGAIVSGYGTDAALDALEADANVLEIEASRPAGFVECVDSVPFVKATPIQRPPIAEEGDQALIGLIDSGIDIMHEAFRDDVGNCRILEIWDQWETGSGPTPSQHDPSLRMNYGRIYTAADITAMLQGNPHAIPQRLRDPVGHGTHVASIAAGRASQLPDGFTGGLAPRAKLVLVIAKIDANPLDAQSVGYSNSHFQALEYFDSVAQRTGLPMVVNVSLGMNAGPHDGTSVLETGFDAFTLNGTKPGRVVVKSAGNELGFNGHARLTLLSGQAEKLRWRAHAIPRIEDLIELWFDATANLSFRLQDPSGQLSSECTRAHTDIEWNSTLGNAVHLTYTYRHAATGNSMFRACVRPGTGGSIQPGEWQLHIHAHGVRGDGVVNAWLERIDSRPTEFLNHQSDETTLSVPGTAQSVITVAAVNSQLPLVVHPRSSHGPTRDQRRKPDLAAPGTAIKAARSQSASGVIAKDGTSMAAPHVTGAVALALSYRAKQSGRTWLTANQVARALVQQTQQYSGIHSPALGYGLLDVERFFQEFYP
jgi:subtilisin family serine protease/V8-like Glu-specific endopeptidase/endonuclease/exonuclease/phosphatase family metal-dependent hydrolase